MADSDIPTWLKSLPLAPVYHPTETEFADPIAFISRIEREASAFGICKVVPPLPKPSKRFVLANLNRSLTSGDSPAASAAVFTTRHQELGCRRGRGSAASGAAAAVQKQVWQSGEFYTFEQFEAKSKVFARAQLGGGKDFSPLLVESKFWKAVTEKPIYVEYANDVPGSGFSAPEERFLFSGRQRKRRKRGLDNEVKVQELNCSQVEKRVCGDRVEGACGSGWKLSNSPWNLQVIARAPGSLTRFMPDEVPGVTSPMVYIGMLFSWFAWHVEDHELHSMNYLHVGAPKTWYAVPGDYADTLEEIVRMQCYGGEIDRLASLAMLGEKTTLLSPEVVVASGVPCCRLVQHPGEFVVTFPRAYHVGFSHGFNCGEAANFATPQWLKIAKEAAVRRAAMNYLPMLSHQQLLYMLAFSFISSAPQEVLSGARSSRFRGRKREEREVAIKRAFLDDMMKEEDSLLALLAKKSISYAVLWEPEFLPSPCAVMQSQSTHAPCEAHKLMFIDDNAQKMINGQHRQVNSLGCDAGHITVSDSSGIAADLSNKSDSNLASKKNSSEDNCMGLPDEAVDNINVEVDGVGDLPFDMNIDSGSLACVACGILGYPFMAIIQPSEKAVKALFPVRCEGSRKNFGEQLQPPNTNSCQPCTSEKFSSDKEVYCGRLKEQKKTDLSENLSHGIGLDFMSQSLCDEGEHLTVGKQHDIICEMSNLQTGPSSLSTVCSISVNSMRNKENEEVVNLEGDLNFLEKINDCYVPEENCCTKWNTSSVFLRPRTFCLQHALEVEELLQSKGGAHVLIICHSDYLKIKALAIAIAEELSMPLSCKDVPLENASSSDLNLINISIDDEGHLYEGDDWTSELGVNLKYCVKVRKQSTSKQETPTLSLDGILSDPSPGTVSTPVSVASDLKWLSKKSRTPYKVIASVTSESDADGSNRQGELQMGNSDGNCGKVLKVNNCKTGRDPRPNRNNTNVRTTLLKESVRDRDTTASDSEVEEFLNTNVLSSSCNFEDHCSNQLLGTPTLVAECPQVLLASRVSFKYDIGGCQKVDMPGDGVTIMDGINPESISDEIVITSGASPITSGNEEKSSDGHLQDNVRNSWFSEGQLVLAEPLLDCKEAQVETLTVKESSVHVIVDHLGESVASLSASHDSDIQKKTIPGVDLVLGDVTDGNDLQLEDHSCNAVEVDVKTSNKLKDSPSKVPEVSHSAVESADVKSCLQEANDNLNDLCRPAHSGHCLTIAWQTSSRYPPGVDLIPYVRQKNKRKREDELQRECQNNLNDFVRSPCEGLRPRNRGATYKDTAAVEKEASLVSRRKVGDSISSTSEDSSKGLKPFKCDMDGCNMSFDTRRELLLHRKNQCTYEGCGKRFSSHKYTVRHLRVHNDDRPLECPWKSCNMTFKWAWARIEHIRIHTGERPYKCKVPGCGQTFRYVSDFSRHRRKTGHYSSYSAR